MHDARDAEDGRLLQAGEHRLLVESYYGVVLDRCRARARTDGDAIDIAADVAIRLLSELNRGRSYRVPFRVVVHQVTTWKINEFYVPGQVVEVELDERLAQLSGSDDFAVVASDFDLERLFAELPPRDREIATLRWRGARDRGDRSAPRGDAKRGRPVPAPDDGVASRESGMMPTSVQALFDEFAAAHARGERPDVLAYLARAGADREELGLLIDRYLQLVPAQPPDNETLVLLTARVEHVTPLTAARTRLPLKVDDVVDGLRDALGLPPALSARLRTAYQELEAGQLDPAGVHERVWPALQKILRLDPRRLLEGPKAKPALGGLAYMRMADIDAVAGISRERRVTPAGEPDEVDFFFRGGRRREPPNGR